MEIVINFIFEAFFFLFILHCKKQKQKFGERLFQQIKNPAGTKTRIDV